jgi:uncharacterized protein DUF2188
MPSKENQLHVVPDGNTWKIDKTHTNESPSMFNSQREAIKEAKSMAMSKGNTEVVIHGSDGRIVEAKTYSP